jgi:hypothetical protein
MSQEEEGADHSAPACGLRGLQRRVRLTPPERIGVLASVDVSEASNIMTQTYVGVSHRSTH